MGDKTGISWTDATWNPIAGCSVLSPACTNCYAMAQAARIQRMAEGAGKPTHYDGTTKEVNGKAVWTGKIVEAPAHIFNAPLNWKRPRKIFVNSMSDIGHEGVSDAMLDRIFAVMALCPHHTFQPLTKRPGRLLEYLATPNRKRMIAERVMCVSEALARQGGVKARITLDHFSACFNGDGPFPNIILGVPVEDQPRADERREAMRALAAMGWRIFVSYEPALGPVDWTGWEFVSQIIVGGESGPDARPMHPAWVRAALAFCRAHGIAFFMKQWGEFYPADQVSTREQIAAKGDMGRALRDGHAVDLGDQWAWRIGKKRAGCALDGVEYHEFPEAR